MTYDLTRAVPVDWNWLKSEYHRLRCLADSERAGSEDGEASEATINAIMACEAVAEADSVIEMVRQMR